ncbi:MAG: glycosyl hydrolase 115 family protein [Verrucomicrobiota bacterium]
MNLFKPARQIALLLWTASALAAFALGQTRYVETAPPAGGFNLCDHDSIAAILADTNDFAGVVRAARDLQKDLARVTGQTPGLMSATGSPHPRLVILGTLGRSRTIDLLIAAGKLDVSDIRGKWESFLVQTVKNPLPGIDSALVICGSDKRGTIYGIYDLSEQIGVSPWYYWADVPIQHHKELYIRPGKFVQGPPSVKYRGIFLNDEAPALTGWVQANYGTVPGHKGSANYGRGFYTNLFELMLRVRANYLWPAMWNNAFNEDDPENPRLADEYGIVMGTSHQEPMLRAQKEWDRNLGRKYGNWNYNNTNQQPVLRQFWREGIHRNRNYESIITLGLRAENDSGMPIGRELTEQIVKAQREILAEELNPDLTQVPQMWCLYKEVQDFYHEGLRVPDDVTLLWAEDNWGNIRRLPSAAERNRRGGAGVYYHFDYHGGPRSYQWINTSPIPKLWDQLSLAKQYGADRIWIVNVGHFKGYEFPLEFFMHLACNTGRWTNENLEEYTRSWAEREFGTAQAEAIARIIATYTQYNGRRKPELLNANTYDLAGGEFEQVTADYLALAKQAAAVAEKLPAESQDAFYELVWFPTKACAQLHALYLAAAKNRLYAKQGRASVNDFAAETRMLFQAQTNLMDHFNRVFANGKWNHFMDQAHLGYVKWNDPPANTLNAISLTNLIVPEPAALGVAIQGSTKAWPGGADVPALPQFDAFHRQTHFVEVFNRGQTPFDFSAAAAVPWIQVSPEKGRLEKDKRLQVSVDWSLAPSGISRGEVKITGAGSDVRVMVEAFNPAAPTRESLDGFVEKDGVVAIEAEHFTSKIDAEKGRWIRIPGYGHTLSAMRTDGPAEVEFKPGPGSACLEYKMYLFATNAWDVETTVGATLNFIPGRALRYGVSFDDEPPQTVTVVPAGFNAQNGNLDWEESVKNNCRRLKSRHVITRPGYHTLKIWMLDPALALQRIVVNSGKVPASYLGPTENFHSSKASGR